MKSYSTKWFKKWSKKVKLSNQNLLDAIKDFESELSTVNLGSNLFKIRVKRKYRGKSSGFRTIVAYKKKERIIFLYGFSKNEKDNINKKEFQYLKKLGNDFLSLDINQFNIVLEQKIIFDLEG